MDAATIELRDSKGGAVAALGFQSVSDNFVLHETWKTLSAELAQISDLPRRAVSYYC